MQEVFLEDEQKVKAFIETISKPRLSKYLQEAEGNEREALLLYHWNSQLAQALYLPLQSWEIALRNKLNSFLCWKFNSKWPYDARARRTLTKSENEKLEKTIRHQTQDRKGAPTTDQIVADLAAGFWVALLGRSYDVPFSWRYNLPGRIFRNDQAITRADALKMCDRLLDLRNRVAHHEPIFHLPLPDRRADLETMLNGLCAGTHAYMASACSFADIWAGRPAIGSHGKGQIVLGQTAAPSGGPSKL
jgi:hypothetical protein